MSQIEGLEFEVKGSSNSAISSLEKLAATLSKLKAVTAGGLAGMKKVANDIRELTKNINGSAVVGGLKTFGNALKATVSAVGGLVGKLGKSGLKGLGSLISMPFKNAIPKVTGFAQKIGGVLSGFKRIVGYRIIRSVIREITQGFQEGIKNLYGWSQAFGGALISGKTFAQTMDGLASSLAYLKNSIGAAAGPLISMLAPAIDFIIDKAVDLINVINQLLARLGGAGSWNRAIRKATEYEDAVGGAGGAAKKALEYLAPFDELNVLPDPKSGGGGGSGTDYSGMFEETTEFADGLTDFADSLKAAVNAGDWEGLGTLLGEKVNDLVNIIDFAGLGSKVGSGINAWFTTKYWTLESINFQNIGAKIAEFLNNALGNIDFETIGRTISQSFTIIGDFLVGAIEELDFGRVVSSLGDTIKGLFNQLSDWLQETDFAELASSLYQGIKDAISQTDWAGIAQSIFQFIGSGIGAAASFIIQLGKDIITDIWNAIKEASKNWDTNGDGELTGKEIINGIWEGIKNAVKNVGQWIKDNIFTPFVNGVKSAFGIHSPSEEMKPIGANIAEGIKEGIKNVFSNIKQWVKDNIFKPIQNAINTAGEKIKVGIQLIKDGWTTVTAWVNNVAQKGKDAVNKGIGLVRSGWDYVSTWIKDKWMGASTPQKGIGIIRKGWDYVSNWIINNWMGASTPNKGIGIVRKGWDFVSNWIINNWMGASTPNKGIGIVRKGWEFVSTWIKDNWMGASTPEKGIGIIRKGWDYVSTWVKDKWMGNAATDQAVGLWKNGWNSVTDWVASAITGTVSQSTWLYINGSTIADRLSYYGNFLADAYLNIIGQTNTPTVYANLEYYSSSGRSHGVSGGAFAKGGAFYGGSWHDIPQAANGGNFHGTLFWAGENGAEVVGNAGGRTEVLNRSQIAATMYASIRSAMSSVGVRVSAPSSDSYGENEDVVYRAIVRALNDTGVDGDIELDGDVLYRKMVQYNKKNTRLTGVNAMA